MSGKNDGEDDRVSRRRYLRAISARTEAEQLLEAKSRELYQANLQLSAHSAQLETAVEERTRELQAALKQAEIAGKAKSRFVATMSHEIRTPLGGLLGMIDLLAMDETDPAKQELLTYASTAGKGLSRIVNDVLDFSKMEAGVFLFEEESVDIRALIESIRMLASSNEASANRTLAVKVSEAVPQLFLGDATRIRQVISNLINNALRYSERGPIVVRVNATQHDKGALLRVDVEDFGVGITPSGIENLFKDFSQISNPLTAAAQGTGLGLAICKRIMEGCGGTIGVESELDVGSTFWFELPVAIAEASSKRAVVTPKEDKIAPANMLDGKRVLLAEDNIINQKLLLTYADRMNLKADLAENGRIALEMFDPEKYDLVLMDVAMPEMDGLEATKRIRVKWAASKMPPIIALTAHVMDAIEEEAAIVGIDTILSKPIPFDTLKQELEFALLDTEQSEVVTAEHPEVVDLIAEPNEANEANDNSAIFAKMAPATVTEMLDIFSEDMLIDLVKKYVEDTATRLEQIAEADQKADTKTMGEQAHSIKGSSMVLGFTEMSEWARQIEMKSKEDQMASDIIKNLKTELASLSACL